MEFQQNSQLFSTPYSETLPKTSIGYLNPSPTEHQNYDTGKSIMAESSSINMKTGLPPFILGTQHLAGYQYVSRTSPTFPSQTAASVTSDASAFYRPTTSIAGGKMSTGVLPSLSSTSHPYLDVMPSGSHYHPYYAGIGLHGAQQRKVPTRETTAPLKAWLKQHKQNPYPTKGEKVMLAMVTRMTLTQVSTWFANARRRMKKDKTVDWSSGDDDVVSEDKDEQAATELYPRVPSRLSTSSSEEEVVKTRFTSSTSLSSMTSSPDSEDEHRTGKRAKKCLQELFEPLLPRPSDHNRVNDQLNAIDSCSSSFYGYQPRTTQASSIYVLPPFMSLNGNGKWPSLPLTTSLSVTTQPTVDSEENTQPIQREKKKIWSISEILG